MLNTKVPFKNDKGEVVGLIGVGHDITERKAAEARLQNTMADLERSNKELEQFAYIASHDLQEPLRMVSSYTQLLAKRFEGSSMRRPGNTSTTRWMAPPACSRSSMIFWPIRESAAGQAARTRRCARHPRRGHAESGCQNRGNPRRHHQRRFADRARGRFAACAGVPEPACQRHQVPARRHPRIHVSAQDKGGEWLFAVKDNGIGIEARHAERVFVIFQRLHTREEYPGTGIGLSVCKRIVERHGGKIWFESEPGNGTTFFFTIPK